ncbi:hypothetical protein [Actinocorallia longicatena]|uniref:Uncharacterized protein n=1 Tax=Actinocorallia longicatena TaxID=111803 RepID=A0ABP6PWD9_9ACTN
MRRSVPAAVAALVFVSGCGPLATVVDQGTEPPLTVVFGGEAGRGRLPDGLRSADLAVASGDATALKAAGVGVVVEASRPGGVVSVEKSVQDHDLVVIGATAPYDRDGLVRAVRDAGGDTVLVYLLPSAGEDACPAADRRDLFGRLVTAGADVVVAAGPPGPGGFVKDEPTVVHYGLGRLGGGEGGLLTLTIARHDVLTADWAPSTARGPRTGAAAQSALARWRGLRTSCPGLTEGSAALAVR